MVPLTSKEKVCHFVAKQQDMHNVNFMLSYTTFWHFNLQMEKIVPMLLASQSLQMENGRNQLNSFSVVAFLTSHASVLLTVRLSRCKLPINSSHVVRDLGRVRQYPPWLLFAAFVESVGCPRYNPQKTRKQWRTRDRRFHWLWGWFPDLKIIFMM